MRRLWRDILNHPLPAALFLIYGLAVWVLHWSLGWNNDVPPAGIVLHFAAPVVAGGLVGWWRNSAQGRGGALAAAVVAVVTVTFVFVPDALDAVLGGRGEAWEWLFEWFVASVVFGGLGSALGLLGASGGAALARAARPSAGRQTAHHDP